MSSPPNPSWRSIFRQHLTSARLAVLDQILHAGSGMTIDANSKILMSNTDAAERLLKWYTVQDKEASLPLIVIARELTETTALDPNNMQLQSTARIIPLEQLDGHEFTQAILHVHTDRSQDSVLHLLQDAHRLLATDGQLVLSRRKRDRLVDVLVTTGVQVPGTRDDPPFADRLDDRLAMLATEAGFAQSGIKHLEESYMVSRETLQQLSGEIRTALSSELGHCNEGSGWKANFDNAIDHELIEYEGKLLTADVLIATKYLV